MSQSEGTSLMWDRAPEKEKELKHQPKYRQSAAKERLKKFGLFLSTVADFFDCAAVKLGDLIFGKDAIAEPRKLATEYDVQEVAAARVTMEEVELSRIKVRKLFKSTLRTSTTYLNLTRSCIEGQLEKQKRIIEGAYSKTQSASKLKLVPEGGKAPQWNFDPVKIAGGMLAAYCAFMQPAVDTYKWKVDYQTAPSQFARTFSAKEGGPTFTSLPNRSVKKPNPPESAKEAATGFKDVSKLGKDFGKRLLDGPSNPSIAWFCKVPMGKTTPGNMIRQGFQISAKNLKLTIDGWDVNYV